MTALPTVHLLVSYYEGSIEDRYKTVSNIEGIFPDLESAQMEQKLTTLSPTQIIVVAMGQTPSLPVYHNITDVDERVVTDLTDAPF